MTTPNNKHHRPRQRPRDYCTQSSRHPSVAELRENCLLDAFPYSHEPFFAQHGSVHRAPDFYKPTESQTVHVFDYSDQKADFKLIRMFLSTVFLPTTSLVTTVSPNPTNYIHLLATIGLNFLCSVPPAGSGNYITFL